jgi:hypothetical protein
MAHTQALTSFDTITEKQLHEDYVTGFALASSGCDRFTKQFTPPFAYSLEELHAEVMQGKPKQGGGPVTFTTDRLTQTFAQFQNMGDCQDTDRARNWHKLLQSDCARFFAAVTIQNPQYKRTFLIGFAYEDERDDFCVAMTQASTIRESFGTMQAAEDASTSMIARCIEVQRERNVIEAHKEQDTLRLSCQRELYGDEVVDAIIRKFVDSQIEDHNARAIGALQQLLGT